MSLTKNWVTTVDAPVGVLVERLRRHVIQERFFSTREGEFLFHGAVSEAGFSLIPVVVQVLVQSVKPYPVHISGEFEPAGEGTTVRATFIVDALMYWAGGLFALALLGMLAYSVAIVPEATDFLGTDVRAHGFVCGRVFLALFLDLPPQVAAAAAKRDPG